MKMQRLHLLLPVDLLTTIDEAARREYCTRSEYLRQAAVELLRSRAQTPIEPPLSDDELRAVIKKLQWELNHREFQRDRRELEAMARLDHD